MLISAPVGGTLGNNLISVIDLGLAEPVEMTKLDNVWVLTGQLNNCIMNKVI